MALLYKKYLSNREDSGDDEDDPQEIQLDQGTLPQGGQTSPQSNLSTPSNQSNQSTPSNISTPSNQSNMSNVSNVSNLSNPSNPFYLTTCFVCGETAKTGQEHIRNYGGIACFRLVRLG